MFNNKALKIIINNSQSNNNGKVSLEFYVNMFYYTCYLIWAELVILIILWPCMTATRIECGGTLVSLDAVLLI